MHTPEVTAAASASGCAGWGTSAQGAALASVRWYSPGSVSVYSPSRSVVLAEAVLAAAPPEVLAIPICTPMPAKTTNRPQTPAKRSRRTLRWRAMTRPASSSPGATSSSSLISASLRLNSSSAWMDTAHPLVFVFGGQQHPQLVEPPAGRGLHGALGDAESRGGIGHRGVEEVAEHQHLALDVGEPAQHADEHVAAVGRLGERGDHRVRAGVVDDAGDLRVAFGVPPPLPAHVDQD